MIEASQIQYVQDQLAAGCSEADVRAALVAAGYTEVHITTLMGAVRGATAATEVVSPSIVGVGGDQSGSAASLSTVQTTKIPWVLLGSIGVLVVLMIGVLLMARGVVPAPAFLSGSFSGGAPYATSNFLPAFAAELVSIEAASVTSVISVTTDVRDADVYPLPEALISPDLTTEEFFAMAAFVPSDFTFTVESDGQFDVKNIFNPNSSSRTKIGLETTDFQAHMDVETIATSDQGFFLKANRFPAVFYDISPVRGQWVQFAESDVFGALVVQQEGQQEILGEVLSSLNDLGQIVEKHNLFLVPDEPQKIVEDDGVFWRYQIAINDKTAKDALLEMATYFTRFEERLIGDGLVPQPDLTSLEADVEEVANAAMIRYINTHVPLVVWVNEKGEVARVGFEARIVAPDEIAPTLADRQIEIDMYVALNDINEPVAAVAPSEFLTLEEAAAKLPVLSLFMSEFENTETQSEEVLIQSVLRNAQDAAELYYDSNGGSYEEVCDGMVEYVEGELFFSNGLFSCRDTATAYRAYYELIASEELYCFEKANDLVIVSEVPDGVLTCE